MIVDLLASRKTVSTKARILDVGCGDGLFFDTLLEFGDVEGVEPAADFIDNSGPHRSRIHVGNFTRDLDLQGRFSIILMLDVLEHLDEPAAALSYASDLLIPSGTLIITVPAFNLLWTRHDDINQHRTRYRKRALNELASNAGLVVDLERYFFHWLFAAKLVTRGVECLNKREPTSPRVPRRWLNKMLYSLSLVESRLFQHLNAPFGSSLMLVAHKPD
jgi:2-polyprenyl-3-methyl-5-hydroxy-6-metoxy-1,4-benzoquinol methylase